VTAPGIAGRQGIADSEPPLPPGVTREYAQEHYWFVRYESKSFNYLSGIRPDLEPWATWFDRQQPQVEREREAVAHFDAEVNRRMVARLAEREVQQRLDSQGWAPPAYDASLDKELAVPRATATYRVAGLAGWNHNVLVPGPRKTGKTTMLANLGAAMSLSRPGQPGKFLGCCDAPLSGNVAYWNFEMDADDLRDEFRPMGGRLDASRIHTLHLRGVPFPVVGNQAAREWACGWLLGQRAEVLFIDTWGALCAANGVRNTNDDAEARAVTSAIDAIKRKTWVTTVFVLIHMPHQTGERHTERFKGAGAVGDWADAIWNYVADDSGTRYLSAIGRSRIDFPESAVAFDPASRYLSLAGGDRRQKARQSLHEKIVAAVAASPGIGADDLAVAAGGNRTAARDEIRRLVAQNFIRVVPEGKQKRHYLPAMLADGRQTVRQI
jgi:AAA domain